MSTDYIMMEDKSEGVELSILEHSNKFDLIMFLEGDACTDETEVLIRDQSVADLKLMAQRLINTISYFDSDYQGCEVSY